MEEVWWSSWRPGGPRPCYNKDCWWGLPLSHLQQRSMYVANTVIVTDHCHLPCYWCHAPFIPTS